MGLHKDFNPVLVMLIDPTLEDFYVLKSSGWVIRRGVEGEAKQDQNGTWWYWDSDDEIWFTEDEDGVHPLPDP